MRYHIGIKDHIAVISVVWKSRNCSPNGLIDFLPITILTGNLIIRVGLGGLLLIKYNFRWERLPTTNQGSNFLWDGFCNRGNIISPIQLKVIGKSWILDALNFSFAEPILWHPCVSSFILTIRNVRTTYFKRFK